MQNLFICIPIPAYYYYRALFTYRFQPQPNTSQSFDIYKNFRGEYERFLSVALNLIICFLFQTEKHKRMSFEWRPFFGEILKVSLLNFVGLHAESNRGTNQNGWAQEVEKL